MSPNAPIYSYLQLAHACPNNSMKQRMESNREETNTSISRQTKPRAPAHSGMEFHMCIADRLLKILPHYYLWTDKCKGYWTCGWETKVRPRFANNNLERGMAAGWLGFYLQKLAHPSFRSATESVFNRSWFLRDSSTYQPSLRIKKQDVWERLSCDKLLWETSDENPGRRS